MKLTWHIFLKDLRRLAGGLLLWSALYVVHFIAYRELRPFDHAMRGDATIGWILDGLWGLEWITAWVLVALLIHGDSLCSDRAAWRTRPISGARLFGAKLLGIVLIFCVWPSLLTLPWWWQLGLSAGEIFRLLAANAIGMAAIAGLAATVAALTPDILRFLGWSCVLVVAAALAVFSIASELSTREYPVGLQALLSMRLALVGLIALVGVVAVLSLQFLRRAYRPALGVAASTAILAGVVAAFWPWGFVTTAEKLGLARREAPQITSRVESVTLFVPPLNVKGKATLEVAMEFTSELRGREAFDWRGITGAWYIDGQRGLALDAPLRGIWRGPGALPSPTENILAGRGDEPRTWKGSAGVRVELPTAIVSRLRAGDVSLRGTASGARWNGDLEGVLPFREGAGAASGFEMIHLATIRGATVDEAQSHYVRGFEIGPCFASGRLMQEWNPSAAGGWREAVVMLRGKGVTWEMRPRWHDWRHPYSAEMAAGLLAVGERIYEYYPETKDNRSNGEPADPARFDDAVVHRLVGREVAPITMTIDETRIVPDLVIEGDLAFARERARAEGKRLLMMTPGRDYDPAAQVLPNSWRDPAVRELLRTRFVCVQAYGDDAIALSRRTREDRFPKFAVWTSDGVLQDTWTDLWIAPRWLEALNAVADSRTYIERLRAEAAAHPDDRKFETQLVDQLLGRGDVAEGVRRLLTRPEIAFNGWSTRADRFIFSESMGNLGWRLMDLATDSEEARVVLRAARQQSIAELARNPSNSDEARRLLLVTFALQDAAAWRAYPGLVPRENADRWSLIASWVLLCDPRRSRPSTVEGLEWESFLRESEDRTRARMADLRRMDRTDFLRLATNARGELVLLGTKGVEALAAGGEYDRAQKMALEVVRLAGYGRRDVRMRLVNILRGKVSEVALREINGR